MNYLIFTCFVLFPLINTYSQQKFLQFKHLTIDDGLSSSTVVSVLQDYKGFIWFGTYDGLNRYNGINFVIYKNIPSDSGSLPENHVRTIFEDHNKNLLLGTYQGLSLYDRDLDRFVSYRYVKSSALYNIGIVVLRIAEDSIGNLWLASDNGLVYFDRNNNKVVQYRHDPNNPGSISNNNLECVYIDKNGRLWIATGKGLNLFIPKTGNFELIKHCETHNESIADIFFLDIIEDREGNIWFGSTDGLFCLENQHNKEKMELVHFKNNPVDPNSISNNRIKSFLIDDEGDLWIGTENGGINLYDRDKKKFLHYRIDEFNPMSLNNESIQAFAQDRNNNLWVCTFGGGVNMSIKNSDFIIHYENLPGAPESLSHNIVACFLEDRYNRKWVGTDGGGFNLFNDKTGRFIRFNMNNSNLNSNAILCMAEGTENQIWMGTWAGGIVSYNYVTNMFKSFTIQNSDISDNNIYSIAKDKIGNLWLGSFEHGLIYYKIKENKFITYSPENSNIAHNRITVVRIDNKGQLYLGAINSLQIFIPGENRFNTYTNIQEDTNSLSNNRVSDILIENDTCIWIATLHGLNRFNPLTRIFKRYFKEDGLPDNIIKGLALDKSGMLWLTTNSGICRFDYHTNKIKNFTKSDGLQSNEFYERSIFTTNNGAILAGGTNGFNLISPEKILENKTIPDVIITDFHIFNEHMKIGIKGSPLNKQISETKKITLTYKQSVLTFYFAVMDFTNPKKNQYAYMMKNFDKDWVYSSNRDKDWIYSVNRREATYTNLNPGKYIFHVKGSNSDGIWNETGTALEINIRPPWWKTKVALTSFVLLTIFIVLGFYFFRIHQLQNQKELLEKLVKKRTRETEEKNKMLYKQTNELNESNVLLEERQQQIEEQNEMLMAQAENLSETNTLLQERQHFIEEQAVELSASNEKLTILNATKDKFFSIIAHDLKNPFTSILGFCEILSLRYEKIDDLKRKKMIGAVYESSKNLFKLLENLLQWARSQTGDIKYEPEELILNELIDTNISLVENLILEKNLEIKQNLERKIKIFADKNMINTVIRNLIINAIKFTETGSISIEVFQDDVETKVSIIDTGIGISNDKVDKIFNVISSKSTYGTRGESGTGLGLIICKEFIERNGGSISVISEPGKGSTFCFTIP